MKAVVAAFNQEKALVGAFSVITNLRMELFEALVAKCHLELACPGLAAAVLWSPALSLVIIQDVQRLPSRSPLMSCHISVNELHIFNFFITHRLMFSRILPVCPNLHLPAVPSLAFTFTL